MLKSTQVPGRVLRLAANPPRRRPVVSLTPLIDVVFILLVFFMLASSFLDWQAIDLDVASSDSGGRSEELEPLWLDVSREQVQLNGENRALTELPALVREHLRQHPDAVVRIRPLADTPVQRVVRVLDRLQAEGITRMAVVRDPSWRADSDSRTGH